MAINKVIVNGETKVDLTADTVVEDKVVKGFTFHDATGELKTGTFEGTAGESIVYSYKLDTSNVIDDTGCIGAGMDVDINIDSVTGKNGTISEFGVYYNNNNKELDFNGIEKATGSYSFKVNATAFTLGCIYVFAFEPIVSVVAYTSGTGGC